MRFTSDLNIQERTVTQTNDVYVFLFFKEIKQKAKGFMFTDKYYFNISKLYFFFFFAKKIIQDNQTIPFFIGKNTITKIS